MAEFTTKSFQLSLNEARMYQKFAEERNFREDFETQVAAAEKGTIFLYSCDLDESAGESARGGYFSRALVEAGHAFGLRNADGSKWYSTKNAFTEASEATTIRHRQQNPK